MQISEWAALHRKLDPDTTPTIAIVSGTTDPSLHMISAAAAEAGMLVIGVDISRERSDIEIVGWSDSPRGRSLIVFDEVDAYPLSIGAPMSRVSERPSRRLARRARGRARGAARRPA